MTTLLIALLAVLVLPLFISTWRIAVLALALQGFIMSLIAWRLEGLTLDSVVTLVDLGIVRTVVAPLALYGAVRGADKVRDTEVSAPSILSWTLALGLVLVAFRGAARLVPEGGDEQTLVAVTASAILLAFLRLATQPTPAIQMIAALRIENAIALLELGSHEHEPVGMQVALALLVFVTVLFFRWYLASFAHQDTAPEGPEL